MAGRSWYLAEAIVTTPSGTAKASPQTSRVLSGDNFVQWIRWRFPPGPNGELGIRFTNINAQIVPWDGQGDWIIGDNESETAQVGFPCLGSISLVSYNLGTYDHQIIISIQYQPIAVTTSSGTPATVLVDLVADEALSQPPELGGADATLFEVTS